MRADTIEAVAAAETATVWGVRHAAATGDGGVDVRADERDARRWLDDLVFCGNTDPVVVARTDTPDAAWIPMGGTQ